MRKPDIIYWGTINYSQHNGDLLWQNLALATVTFCFGNWDHIWGMGERCGLKVAKL